MGAAYADVEGNLARYRPVRGVLLWLYDFPLHPLPKTLLQILKSRVQCFVFVFTFPNHAAHIESTDKGCQGGESAISSVILLSPVHLFQFVNSLLDLGLMFAHLGEISDALGNLLCFRLICRTKGYRTR